MIPRLPETEAPKPDTGPLGDLGPAGPLVPDMSPEPATVVPISAKAVPSSPVAPPVQPAPEFDERAAKLIEQDDIGREYQMAQAAREDADAMQWMMQRAQATGAMPPPEPVVPKDGVASIVEHRAAKAGMPSVMGAAAAVPDVLSRAGPVLSDVATGLTTDAGNIFLGGPLLAIKNSLDLIDEIGTWLNNNVADLRVERLMGQDVGPAKVGEQPLTGDLVPNPGGVMDKPESVTGNIAQAMTQFLTGFFTGRRVMGMGQAVTRAGQFGQSLIAGAYADLTAFKGADANLATLIQMVPELRNPVTAYLAHEGEDDSEIEKRLQNVVAGAVPNAVFDGFLAGLRAFREYRRLEKLVHVPGDTTDDVARKIARVVENDPNIQASAPEQFGKRVEDYLGKPEAPDIEVKQFPPPLPEQVADDAMARSTINDTGIGTAETARQMVGTAETPPAQPQAGAAATPAAPRPVPSDLEVEVWWPRNNRSDLSVHLGGENDLGNIDAVVNAKAKTVTIDYSIVHADLRGKGYGLAMYKRLVDEALDRGYTVRSDVDMTDAAQGVYSRLRELGYTVEQKGKRFVVTGREAPQAAKPKPPPVPGSPERPMFSETYVNWSRINSSDDVKRMMGQMIDAQPDQVAAAQRGVRTNAQTAAAAEDIDAWKLLVGERKENAAKILSAEEQYALRTLWTSAGDKLIELARAAREGGPEELYAFRRMMATYDIIQKEVVGIRTETARALQQWAMPAGSSTKVLEDINNALIRSGGLDFNQAMAEKIVSAAEMGGQRAIDEIMKKTWRAKSADALREIWINSILSGPKTHLVNTISNSAVFAHALTERAVAGRLGNIISPVDGVRIGEATAMMQGLRQSYRDAFRLAAKAWKTGQSGFGMQQIDAPRMNTISAEGFQVSSNSAMGKALDAVGSVVNIPGRALGAADEFFKTINYRAELWAQAFRRASEEVDRGILSSSKLKDRMAEIIMDPPDDIATAARDLAKYNTFTNDPGQFSRAVMKIRSIVDHKSTEAFGMPSASFVVPFLNTPANIFSYTFERTPIAPIMGRFKADLAAGGARANMAMAKLGLGSMMMTVAYDMAMDGEITGSGPTGQKNWSKRAHMRSGGWQPYSVRVKVGEDADGTPQYRWFAYNRLDPLGSIVGLSADLAEYARNHNDGVDIEVLEAFAAGIFATAENLTSKAYLSGFADFVEAMQDYQYKSEYFMNRLLSSFVPTGVKEVAQFMDPRAKQTTNLVDAIKSRLPGMSDEVPGRLNYWGDPIEFSSGLGSTYDALSPIYSSSNAKATPIDREFFRINYFPRHPGYLRVDGRNVTLRNMPEARNRMVELTAATPAERLVRDNLDDLVTAKGGKAVMRKLQEMGNRTLKEALNDLIQGKLGRYSLEYQAAADSEKWREVSQIITLYRKASTMQVLREFPRISEVRAAIPERAETAEDAPF